MNDTSVSQRLKCLSRHLNIATQQRGYHLIGMLLGSHEHRDSGTGVRLPQRRYFVGNKRCLFVLRPLLQRHDLYALLSAAVIERLCAGRVYVTHSTNIDVVDLPHEF